MDHVQYSEADGTERHCPGTWYCSVVRAGDGHSRDGEQSKREPGPAAPPARSSVIVDARPY
jgi:hypothetical protein